MTMKNKDEALRLAREAGHPMPEADADFFERFMELLASQPAAAVSDEQIIEACSEIYLSDHPRGSQSYDIAVARAVLALLSHPAAQQPSETAIHNAAIEAAAKRAEYVFKDSCNHTHDAIEYMKAVLLNPQPAARAGQEAEQDVGEAAATEWTLNDFPEEQQPGETATPNAAKVCRERAERHSEPYNREAHRYEYRDEASECEDAIRSLLRPAAQEAEKPQRSMSMYASVEEWSAADLEFAREQPTDTWNAHDANDSMRHPEASDLSGGETDQPAKGEK